MHAPASAVRAVAFDVIETLMSLDPVRTRLREIGRPAELYDLWFARAVRDGMALGAAGGYKPFREVMGNALQDVTGHGVAQQDIDHVLEGWEQLPAYPDVAPALQRLSDAGVRLACLTTGSAETIQEFLQQNDLSGYFERVISCEEIGVWKPARAVYHHAAGQLGLSPESVTLVAAHAWDCHGAAQAGLGTGWISRLEGLYSATFDPPDITSRDLDGLAQQLVNKAA